MSVNAHSVTPASNVQDVNSKTELHAAQLVVEGLVQGVGFRPFISRLAHNLKLSGEVSNTRSGVYIVAEGTEQSLLALSICIHNEAPTMARVDHLESMPIPVAGRTGFRILPSSSSGVQNALVLPDVVTCNDCLAEILDPHNRRYRYPFTNCTNCGPRYSIQSAVPFDRAQTAMADFELCGGCADEYANHDDKRCHAQAIACARCGPQLMLIDSQNSTIAQGVTALDAAVKHLLAGKIIALKGIGGYQLLVDASNGSAVQNLRDRKGRPDKPFAVMIADLQALNGLCVVTGLEKQLLTSEAGPIVVLERVHYKDGIGRPNSGISHVVAEVAPNNPLLGVMLPTTPLHHLLSRASGRILVATSGNINGEPMVHEDADVQHKLGNIADFFLTHNRPIINPVDDSVVRVIAGKPQILRRARGYSSLPLRKAKEVHTNRRSKPGVCVLAVGGESKAAPAFLQHGQVILEPPISHLTSHSSRMTLQHSIDRLKTLFGAVPEVIAHDNHPQYYTTQWSETSPLPATPVQHHAAHIAACLFEHGINKPALGVAWDGTGYGTDGTVWGGEFLHFSDESIKRVASFYPFYLPGSDSAVLEPRRTAAAVLYELYGEDALFDTRWSPVQEFSQYERTVLCSMLKQSINTPATSSVGRLFDAVASLLGLCHTCSFEGQAAMALEYSASLADSDAQYPLIELPDCIIHEGDPVESSVDRTMLDYTNKLLVIDWRPPMVSLLNRLIAGESVHELAAAFHRVLGRAIVTMAQQHNENTIALSGGCFQNRYLTEYSAEQLYTAGFNPVWSQAIPPNDSGLAVGQALLAAREFNRRTN